jgi:hypothetical protein
MSSKLIPEGNSNAGALLTEDGNSKVIIAFEGDDSGFWCIWTNEKEVFLDKHELKKLWMRIGGELSKCTFEE